MACATGIGPVADTTDIQWCDSTVNGQMGCDGCELWAPRRGIQICYAGRITDSRAGQRGWPKSFGEPALFTDRIMEAALHWRDLSGTTRPAKPWLDGMPRVIFLNDMGDTFTESLPLEWLAPFLPVIARSPHLWLILTKRVDRLDAFAERWPLPENVWVGTSVTDRLTLSRVTKLRQVRAALRFVSFEPLHGPVPMNLILTNIAWAIAGGGSGEDARPFDVQWARDLSDLCHRAQLAFFLKQLGAYPFERCGRPASDCSIREHYYPHHRLPGIPSGPDVLHPILDPHGGDWTEWPEPLRVRTMPRHQARLGQGSLL